jgi:hypothetical protein
MAVLIIVLAVLAAIVPAAYLAAVLVRGIASGTLPPNSPNTRLSRRNTPFRFWLLAAAVGFAVVSLGALANIFVFAILSAQP